MRATFTEGYTYQDNLLTEYQHKLGHDVIVLTTTQCRNQEGKITQVSPCDKIMSNGVRLIRIKPGSKVSQIIGYHKSIGQLIKKLKPDLIFIHGLSNLIPQQAIQYKKENEDTIIVADNHQDTANSKTNGFPFAQLISMWRLCWKGWIKYFNHIYGTTSWRRDFAIKYFGIPPEKVEVLMMGVDSAKLPRNPIEVRHSVRTELGIRDSEMVYIHGGKMNHEKKTLQVIKAFKTLPNDNTRLILFGSISDEIKEDFCKEISENNHIIYLGYIDSSLCNRFFFASDFAVFPGLHSVLWEESTGCGLPGLFGRYSENDHINICDNCIQIDLAASVEEIAIILHKVLTDLKYFADLKIAATKAALSLSYFDIAKKSIRP